MRISDWSSDVCSSDLYQFRDLPNHSPQYNYYDYIDTWFKVLLYQNKTFSHSWFLQFDQKFKSELPTWFLRWWTHYGAIPDIFPSVILDQVNYFSTVFSFTPQQREFPQLLIFISKYKIPWIFKWQYGISGKVIQRLHKVKWWNNFKIQRIVDIVQTEFPINIHAPTPAMVKAHQIPTAPVTKGSQLPPVNLGSPSSSSSKPKSSKSKIKSKSAKPSSDQPKSKDKSKSKVKPKSKSSKDELLQMARLLIAQAKSNSDNSSSEDGLDNSNSSEGSTTQNPYGLEFQNAQDSSLKSIC